MTILGVEHHNDTREADHRQQLIVVVGMHRSGTSAITRGMEVLGVSLGNRLMLPIEGINEKGFYEDIDLVALNEELLSACGKTWHSLEPIQMVDVESLCDRGYLLQAIELLRKKISSHRRFGFKDPRTAKLMPFWARVFSAGGFDVSFILATRNPISIARSLEKRDGLSAEQVYYLWADYIVSVLPFLHGQPVVIVDYDQLLRAPEDQLRRMADHLKAIIDPKLLLEYQSAFLDKRLCHSKFRSEDVNADVSAPVIAKEIYAFIADIQAGKTNIEHAINLGILKQWRSELDRQRPLLRLSDKQHRQLIDLKHAVAERHEQITSLSQSLSERDEQIVSQNESINTYDELVARLTGNLSEQSQKIAELGQAFTEQNHQIAHLTHAASEREEQIACLKRILDDKKNQILSLNQTIFERDKQIADILQSQNTQNMLISSLNQALAEGTSKIAALNRALSDREGALDTIIASHSWKITKPVRWGGRLLRGEFDAALDPFRKRLLAWHKNISAKRDWHRIAKGKTIEFTTPTHPVAVILPVYRDVEMTQRCIVSAMKGIASLPGACLLVINDASPDLGMREMLESIPHRWPNQCQILHNDVNLGFVRTMNLGIEHLAGYDVVFLNSDTILPDDWLARLRREAYSIPNAGTVTPCSNNATICSFPVFLQENSAPYGLDVHQVDAVFRSHSLENIEAPTGVGFCMYVRRACLNDIGILDAERFYRGYGEENDLCQRALKSGWVNLITPNLYVFHEGSVSFSTEKHTLVEQAMKVLGSLHPRYHHDVAEFVSKDPLRKARVTRHLQLLNALSRPKVLYISHKFGGGVRQHLEELFAHLGKTVFCLLLTPDDSGGVELRIGAGKDADLLRFGAGDYAALQGILHAAGISCVHYHHTMGFTDHVLALPEALGVKWLLTVHDYYWLNGNPTLTDEDGRYNGYSDRLVNASYLLPGNMTPADWRNHIRNLLEKAECVIFPSATTKEMFDGHFKIAHSAIASHPEKLRDVHAPIQPWNHSEHLVIGVLGALSKEKGADWLEELALLAQSLNKPYTFRLLGYAYRPLRGVLATGAYQPNELSGLIHQQNCGVIFFPALWPETYSYTLSYALASGLPIIAPNIGAFPERLSGREQTWLYPSGENSQDLLAALDAFLAALDSKETVAAPKWEKNFASEGFYGEDYLSIVTECRRVALGTEDRLLGACPDHVWQTSRASSTWRESALCILWLCYMHPSLQVFGRLIPAMTRRAIRRRLSTRPIHEIISS